MEVLLLKTPEARARLRKIGPALLKTVISQIYLVSVEELCAPNRGNARVSFARQVAMYLMHVGWGLSLGEVARAFGREKSTAAHACQKIEELRDVPAFDRQMAQLEVVLCTSACIEVRS